MPLSPETPPLEPELPEAMNRWLVPNKLTVQSYPEQVTDEY